MELHYKCTMWCKLKFSDEVNREEVVKKLGEGLLPLEIGYDGVVEDTEWDVILGSEKFITTEENNGQPTIKLFDDTTKEPIWNNINL